MLSSNGEADRMTSEELATFIERRRRFVEAIGDGLAIIPAAQETARNSDVSHPFRQNSDFFFLTGFDEPDAVAIFNPVHAKERYVLFVRPRDREMEIWTGHRAGVEGAVAAYGADVAYPVDQLDAKLREYAVDRSTLVYRLGNPGFDSRVLRLVSDLRNARAASRRPRGSTIPARSCTSCGCAARPPSWPASAAPARSAATPTSRRCATHAPACTSTRCRRRWSSCSVRRARRATRIRRSSPPGPTHASFTTWRTAGRCRTVICC